MSDDRERERITGACVKILVLSEIKLAETDCLSSHAIVELLDDLRADLEPVATSQSYLLWKTSAFSHIWIIPAHHRSKCQQHPGLFFWYVSTGKNPHLNRVLPTTFAPVKNSHAITVDHLQHTR